MGQMGDKHMVEGLQFTFEPLNHLLNTGISELGERSWNEIGDSKHLFKYDPDWHQYQKLQDQNMLRFLAIRDEDGNLIGYVSIMVMNSLHDRKILCAIIQDIYIEPEHRKGMDSIRNLDRFLTDKLRDIGVKQITIAERENDPRGGVGSVYSRLGYKSCERIWTKDLV